jgi:hypothetical protein
MKRWLVMAVLLLLLGSGCTGVRYVNPQGNAFRDDVECRALAEQSVPPGGILRSVIVSDHFRKCLVGRGYSPEPKTS